MKNLRVVFMGTPEFSLLPLQYLIDNTNVVLVVTKKDAVVGRKKELVPSPVKKLALAHNIPVYTPGSIKKYYGKIIDSKPDIIITCAYGKIIPKELIDYPKYGCLNIHASILPKYRGSSPMQYAIMNGEKETGITLMYMDEFMDTGDIIDIIKCPINEKDNLGIIHDKLSLIGENILRKNLPKIIENKITRTKQDEKLATYTKMITSEMEELDFKAPVRSVYNKIRAFSPYPLVKTKVFAEEIKIKEAHYEEKESIVGKVYVNKNSLGIGCLDGIIYFDIVKPSGKKEMNIKNYLNGKQKYIK